MICLYHQISCQELSSRIRGPIHKTVKVCKHTSRTWVVLSKVKTIVSSAEIFDFSSESDLNESQNWSLGKLRNASRILPMVLVVALLL